MFFAYNNGITATAEEVDIYDDGGRLLLRRLKNFQIVNGGQTTASIHSAQRRQVHVSQAFVQMKLSVVDPERANRLVPKISEFANSQNRVSAADFFANHPFHVRMEEFSRRIYAPSPDGTFRESKWFYERARGQYAHSRRSHAGPAQEVRSGEPAAATLHEDGPREVRQRLGGTPLRGQSRGAEELRGLRAPHRRAVEYRPDDFNEGWYREAVGKAIVFKATERIVTDQSWYEGGYRANIVAYAIRQDGTRCERSRPRGRLPGHLAPAGTPAGHVASPDRRGRIGACGLDLSSPGYQQRDGVGEEAGLLESRQRTRHCVASAIPRRPDHNR